MAAEPVDVVLDALGNLAGLVVLAMLLERALAFLFEYYWFRKAVARIAGLKGAIAFLAAWMTCLHLRFDILARLFRAESGEAGISGIGLLLTAAVLAGGSAAAMTLFQGVLRFGRDARVGMIALGQARIQADLAEALARKDAALPGGAHGPDCACREARPS